MFPEQLRPFGTVADFDLSVMIEKVKSLPGIEGEWADPASLSRFGIEEMPWKMHRRFARKIIFQDMGYRAAQDPDSHWPQFDQPCWLWQGALHPKGYGRFWLGKEPVDGKGLWAYCHRLAFEHWVTIPPPGYIVDHECNIKTCCNPVHLWPLSGPDNTRIAHERRPWKRRNQYSKE